MKGRAVLVTGGGRGIGRAICRRFGAEGSHVVAAARSLAELEETRRLIEADGGCCAVLQCDVGDAAQVKELIESTAMRVERIDVLVNCAGVVRLGEVDDLSDEGFEHLLNVNIRGVYRCCRAVWPVMKSGGGGVIINISSVASVDAFPGLGAYGATKAWVDAWTRSLAEEGRPWGIRVFSVAPGAVETTMLRQAIPDFPTEKTLSPNDVAGVVYALAGPDCRYATGQRVSVRK